MKRSKKEEPIQAPSSDSLKILETMARNKRAALLDAETGAALLDILQPMKLRIQRSEIRGNAESFGEVIRVPEFVIVVAK